MGEPSVHILGYCLYTQSTPNGEEYRFFNLQKKRSRRGINPLRPQIPQQEIVNYPIILPPLRQQHQNPHMRIVLQLFRPTP